MQTAFSGARNGGLRLRQIRPTRYALIIGWGRIWSEAARAESFVSLPTESDFMPRAHEIFIRQKTVQPKISLAGTVRDVFGVASRQLHIKFSYIKNDTSVVSIDNGFEIKRFSQFVVWNARQSISDAPSPTQFDWESLGATQILKFKTLKPEILDYWAVTRLKSPKLKPTGSARISGSSRAMAALVLRSAALAAIRVERAKLTVKIPQDGCEYRDHQSAEGGNHGIFIGCVSSNAVPIRSKRADESGEALFKMLGA